MKLAGTVSLYIHIPYCVSKCDYCDFFSVPCGKNPVPDGYVSALCREISFRLSGADAGTIYIGGGTPSLLSCAQLERIVSAIYGSARIADNAEFTVEVNPDDVTADLLSCLRRMGVNRLSCGVQSLCADALAGVRRRAGPDEVVSALELVRSGWDGRFSIDMISGLPGEAAGSFISSLEEILRFGPDHVSVYSLTVEEGTPLGRRIESGAQGYDPEAADSMWISARDFLESHGFIQYEVSNFCLPGSECRHNLAYWNHVPYIGCGSGAVGTTYYSDGSGLRVTSTSDLAAYIAFWNSCAPDGIRKPPQQEERIPVPVSEFEFFMTGLRQPRGVTGRGFRSIFGRDVPEDAVSVFRKWQDRGLFRITEEEDGSLRFSPGRDGVLFLNAFLGEIIGLFR